MVSTFGRARGVRVDELNVILARPTDTPFAQVGVVHNVIAVGEAQVLREADLDLLDKVVPVNVFTVDVRPEFGLVHDSVVHFLLSIAVSWSDASILQPGVNRHQLRKVHARLEILQLCVHGWKLSRAGSMLLPLVAPQAVRLIPDFVVRPVLVELGPDWFHGTVVELSMVITETGSNLSKLSGPQTVNRPGGFTYLPASVSWTALLPVETGGVGPVLGQDEDIEVGVLRLHN